jgi:hypothetical protein
MNGPIKEFEVISREKSQLSDSYRKSLPRIERKGFEKAKEDTIIRD